MDISYAVTLHRFLIRAAFTGVLFAWIGVFASIAWFSLDVEKGFVGVLYLYAIAHIIIFLLTPLIGERLRSGVRRLLTLGTLLHALALSFVGVALLRIQSDIDAFWFGMVFAIVWGLYRAIYAFPYSVHVHSVRTAHAEIFLACIPLCAAILFSLTSFTFVSVVFALCALASLIPLSHLSEHVERYEWTVVETWSQMLVPYNRTFVAHAIAQGIERSVLFFIWPLIILLFSGSMLVFGILMTVTMLATYYSRAYLRRFFEWLGIHKSPAVAYISLLTIWSMRALSVSPVAVLITTTTGVLLPHTHHHHDAEVFVDEYSALREISSALGAILACIFAIALSYIVSLPSVFFGTCVFAACAALYAQRLQHRADVRV